MSAADSPLSAATAGPSQETSPWFGGTCSLAVLCLSLQPGDTMSYLDLMEGNGNSVPPGAAAKLTSK